MPESKPVVEKTVREKDLLLPRISKILDRLIQDNEVFNEADRSRIIESLSDLVEKSSQELIPITDDELARRVEKVMAVEAIAGMLSGLSPRQIESFEAAAKRRKLFN